GAVGTAELIVVPALAVDRTGVRLGRGGGSYDRALARCGPAALTVALVYDEELIEHVPAQPHDRRVRAVVTPSGGLRRLSA
ncbi:5-formyltetrahydrofolate cyclo-ligase, partial [Micromonospora zhanjiangensis]